MENESGAVVVREQSSHGSRVGRDGIKVVQYLCASDVSYCPELVVNIVQDLLNRFSDSLSLTGGAVRLTSLR